MVEKFKPYCDAIIVGSAIIKKVAIARTKEEAVKKVKDFTIELAKSLTVIV